MLPRNVLLMTVSLDFLLPPRHRCRALRNHDRNSTLSPRHTYTHTQTHRHTYRHTDIQTQTDTGAER